MNRSAVVALGGNALTRKGEKFSSFEQQREVIARAATQIAEMMDAGWRLAITHGNGPQVGDLLLMSRIAHDSQKELPEIAIDAANAYTQGSLGYLIAQAVRNALCANGDSSQIASLVTQVVVDSGDPAFRDPTKFVGPAFEIEEANELSIRLGWRMKEDRGRGWRRVVPSPKPREIVELPVIKKLIAQGISVITVGGGGIPVVKRGGELKGVAAVIDKDWASSLLARGLGADLLVFVTQVEHVFADFGRPSQRPLEELTTKDARRMLEQGQFPAGSMGPKIEAAIEFLENGGKGVLITDPANLTAGIEGRKGTRVVP